MSDPVNVTSAEQGSAEWWLGRLEKRLIARQTPMQLHDDYYHGKHRMNFNTARILGAFGKDFRELRLNYCGVVIEALNERLAVDGFSFGDDARGAAAAWEIWQRSGLDAAFSRGTRSGLVKAEFALLVWPDATGEPRIYVEDGAEVVVATDPADPHLRRAALKRWYDEDERRLFATIYFPTGIYKYRATVAGMDDMRQTGQMPDSMKLGGGAGPTLPLATIQSGNWERREVEGEAWPVPNPYGVVPVISLPNRPDLASVGESEIARVVPIQDAINANLVNVMLAGQFSAFRQKWATNVRLDVDEATGKPKEPWQIAVDSLITAPPPKPGDHPVEFGEFTQTELSGYISLHEALVQGIATITRTPPHYFLGSSGAWPSGESLRSAETGLTAKARERGRDFGDQVETAVALALRMKAVATSTSSAARTRYLKWATMTDAEAVWRDPEIKTESAHIDALNKMLTLGVPREAIWEMIPASPQKIALWKAMREAALGAPPSPEDLAQKTDALGILIRSGYEPAAAARLVGLPSIAHTGLVPVTLQGEKVAETGQPTTPSTSG